MSIQLAHVIKFVADMDKAVAFHRDVLGLKLKFASPEWSEFLTGETTLALHPVAPDHPAGTAMIGYKTADLKALYAERDRRGLEFLQAPADLHGNLIAYFADADGAKCTIEQG